MVSNEKIELAGGITIMSYNIKIFMIWADTQKSFRGMQIKATPQ